MTVDKLRGYFCPCETHLLEKKVDENKHYSGKHIVYEVVISAKVENKSEEDKRFCSSEQPEKDSVRATM